MPNSIPIVGDPFQSDKALEHIFELMAYMSALSIAILKFQSQLPDVSLASLSLLTWFGIASFIPLFISSIVMRMVIGMGSKVKTTLSDQLSENIKSNLEGSNQRARVDDPGSKQTVSKQAGAEDAEEEQIAEPEVNTETN